MVNVTNHSQVVLVWMTEEGDGEIARRVLVLLSLGSLQLSTHYITTVRVTTTIVIAVVVNTMIVVDVVSDAIVTVVALLLLLDHHWWYLLMLPHHDHHVIIVQNGGCGQRDTSNGQGVDNEWSHMIRCW